MPATPMKETRDDLMPSSDMHLDYRSGLGSVGLVLVLAHTSNNQNPDCEKSEYEQHCKWA